MRGKRLARLLRYIDLFRGPKSYNARRLAERFDCSRRNVYRDLAVLELAGVPFYYDGDFGEGGGYRIRPDYFFPTVQLTRQEAMELAMLTRGAEAAGGIPLLERAVEAGDKVLAGLGSGERQTIAAASELFDILGLRLADHSRCGLIMRAFQEALLTRRQVQGVYRSPHEAGRRRQLRLQPRRVFLAGQSWYAVCNDGDDDKLYRLSRFDELRVVDCPVTVGEDFSLRQFLGNAWVVYRGERDWDVEILFDAEAGPLVAETRWHETQRLEIATMAACCSAPR